MMNYIIAAILGATMSFAYMRAQPVEQYVPIEILTMSEEVLQIEVDPMVFMITPAGEMNVFIHYKRNEKDGFHILVPMHQVIDLRHKYSKKEY